MTEAVYFEGMLSWTRLGSLASWITVGVLIGAALLALREIRESMKARKLEGYANIINWLQDEKMRKARGRVFRLKKTDWPEWSAYDKSAVEQASQSYATIGIMLEHKLIPKDIVYTWRKSIRRCWRIAEPYIKKEREGRPQQDLWKEFERLATEHCSLSEEDQKEEENWWNKEENR